MCCCLSCEMYSCSTYRDISRQNTIIIDRRIWLLKVANTQHDQKSPITSSISEKIHLILYILIVYRHTTIRKYNFLIKIRKFLPRFQINIDQSLHSVQITIHCRYANKKELIIEIVVCFAYLLRTYHLYIPTQSSATLNNHNWSLPLAFLHW